MTTDTLEAPTADQAAEEAAFLEAASQSTGTPIEKPAEPAPAEPTATEPTAEATPAAPVEEPEVVKLTKAQYTDLMELVGMKADLHKAVSMRSKLEEGFGTLGGLQQKIKQMEAGGAGLTVSKEDFEELVKAEFPEFAGFLAQGLNRIFSRMKPGGGIDLKQGFEELKGGLLQEAENRVRNAACIEYLDDEHAGWQELVGLPYLDATGKEVIPDTAFRRWAATTYPKEQYDRIFASKNGPMLAKVIDRFKNESAKKDAPKEPAKPDPKAMERKERVAAAVQPNSLPPTGAPTKTEEDEYYESATATLKSRGLV